MKLTILIARIAITTVLFFSVVAACTPANTGPNADPARRYWVQLNDTYGVFCVSLDEETLIARNCEYGSRHYSELHLSPITVWGKVSE